MRMLINAALSRTRTVLLLFALVLIAGVAAFQTIPREAEPDVTIPIVYVSLGMDGISPDDADRMLVRPVTRQIQSVEGLDTWSSVATEGHASITLEFRSGVDIDQALEDVRREVDKARNDLPQAADEPSVNEINLSLFPVLNINLYGRIDDATLYAVAERLQDEIEGLGNVLEAPIRGLREDITEILIDPAMMASYNLSTDQVIAQVQRNNQLVTAGSLDTGAGRFSLKVPGLIETENDILDLPIKSTRNTTVRFRDIAIGQRTYADHEQFSRVNGQPAVTLEVTKRTGANIIETVEQVRQIVENDRANWPDGLQSAYTGDRSTMIKQTLGDLFNNVGLATILVVVVMLWALGVRSSLLIGVAIPASFLAGVLWLYLLGNSLNIIVLFALILSIGMLVDGAIVVVEYADRRLSDGVSRREAYREAASRMAWPVIASTATTLAVFLPLLFWPGMVGDFMGYLPLTVILTMGSSLFVALIILPALGALIGKATPLSRRKQNNLVAASQGNIKRMRGAAGLYIWGLSKLLRVPALVLGVVIFAIASLVFVYTEHGNGVEFFPQIDSEFGNVVVRARGNLSLEEKDTLVRDVESIVLDMPQIKAVNTLTSAEPIQNQAADVIGVLQLELVDWRHRGSALEVLDIIVENTAHIPGIIVERQPLAMGPTAGVDLQLEVTGDDRNSLVAAVRDLTDWMSTSPDYIDVSNDLPLPGLEWRIDVDRSEAARLGADLSAVGSTLSMMTTGVTIGSYRPADTDDEVDIRLRYPFNGRDLDQIDRLTVTANGQQVPLSNFTERRAQPKEGDVKRSRNDLAYTIEANAARGQQVTALATRLTDRVESGRAEGLYDESITASFAGDQAEQAEAGQFLTLAFLAAVALMFVILVTQFNSIYQALLIMSAILLSSAGVLIGLLITGQPFGVVMVGVGIIALAGIVVNNNIVLIDTYNLLKAQGDSPYDAAVKTAAQRLRPVLLTTITTVLGLLPMVLQLNFDLLERTVTVGAPASQWWTQLSTAIAGGLTFATVLTLVLTPCLLVGIDNMLAATGRGVDRFKSLGVRRAEKNSSQDAAPEEVSGD